MGDKREEKLTKDITDTRKSDIIESRKKYKKAMIIGVLVIGVIALICFVIGKSTMTIGWVILALLYYFALNSIQERCADQESSLEGKIRYPGYIKTDFAYMLEEELKMLGFTNVQMVANNVKAGLFSKRGVISRVTIDGIPMKTSGWYFPDVEIIIEYQK